MKNNPKEAQKLPKSILSLFVVLSLLSLFFVIAKGPIISADSKAYFGMWPYVSAGYPFFLRSLHFLFGDNYAIAAVGIQFVLVLSSVFFFIKCFLAKFSLKNYQLSLLLILLFYPVFDNNIYAVNNITTEGLSYAIFLQIIYVSYLIFFKRRLRAYILLLLLTVTLIIIRGQFYVLMPLFIGIELLLAFKEKKFNVKPFLFILLIPVLTNVIDNSYHRIVQKQYFSTPFSWTALVSSVLFVSDESDEQYIQTEEAKIVFKLIHKHFREKGIGYQDHKYYQEPIDYNYFFFHYEFPTICMQTIQQETVNHYVKKDIDIIQAYLVSDKIHKQLFFDLIPHKFSKWSALIFQSFKTGIGGISVMLIYVITLFLLLKYYFYSGNKMLLFFAFLILIIVANRVIVSLTVHSLTRYFFYNNWIPLFILFFYFNQIEKLIKEKDALCSKKV